MATRKINPYKSPYYSNWVVGVDFTIGAETGGNTKAVTIQLKGGNGQALAGRGKVDVFLSDSAAGAGLTAAAPSGGIAVSGTGAAALAVVTAGKHLEVQTGTTGSFVLTLIEATAKTFYIAVVLPDGSIVVSGAVTFA